MISPLPHGGNALQKCRNLSTRKVVLTHVEVSGGDPNNQQVTNNKAKQSTASKQSQTTNQEEKEKNVKKIYYGPH